MNPITRLFIYVLFSLSIMVSTTMEVFLMHLCFIIIILIYKWPLSKELWSNFKPFLFYLPISGLIFFIISTILTTKSINIIAKDVMYATVRLYAMILVMSIYITEKQSNNLLIAVRGLWYDSKINIIWLDKIILFFELTLRLFPSTKQIWFDISRAQKAISKAPENSKLKNTINISKSIPDYILLNLNSTEKIVENMVMRGYGKSARRSVYPHIKFSLFDVYICFFLVLFLSSIHSFV